MVQEDADGRRETGRGCGPQRLAVADVDVGARCQEKHHEIVVAVESGHAQGGAVSGIDVRAAG